MDPEGNSVPKTLLSSGCLQIRSDRDVRKMRREPPRKSLFSYAMAQTNQGLGRDKGKIRLCFGNCGKKEAMSQCLLSPEKYIAHWGGRGAKPVHVSGGGVGRADQHTGIWREWSWGGG